MAGILESKIGKNYQSNKSNIDEKIAKSKEKQKLINTKVSTSTLREIKFLKQIWGLKFNYEVLDELVKRVQLSDEEKKKYEILKELL
ncbi:hypothetical protein [Ligilactobacillus salivarius]|uniref:Uncharacterized protein n=1 Tax=Ligilactobacillus salivarius TaxID=1624 RepID=A0A9X6XJ91_9LACO|nr:hypothetical protein [Ligilactobacillus salivarius]PEG97372.1 hypothetical protein CP360_01545 [Lactobacillus sp. UMNPBX9]MBE7392171.1 hypothetical protein [Ligilactobacillus salivarius]OTF88727.1 hypothetical protein A8C38_10075 [Ligilactobacillus salivarius]PAY27940.1 hypothetical protein A8C33_05260 [Ligilactobacillus salivarius]PAY29271.1 hypothetical protein A8C44_02135 [Ligilactobacillus salivarius]